MTLSLFDYIFSIFWFSIYPIALFLVFYLIEWYEKNTKRKYRKLLKLALAINFVIIGSFFAPWAVIKNTIVFGFEFILSGNLLVILPFVFFLLATFILARSKGNVQNWASFLFFILGEIIFFIGIFVKFWGLALIEGYQDLTFGPALTAYLVLFNSVVYAIILEWTPKNKFLRKFVHLGFQAG